MVIEQILMQPIIIFGPIDILKIIKKKTYISYMYVSIHWILITSMILVPNSATGYINDCNCNYELTVNIINWRDYPNNLIK